ncbi:ATPase domain-containing protein [Desulfosporosinus fructosivorans]|uniref:ATPase domain-containing protein n=1 Tax=Desulfosporosinus fructosivorans TaxID=2018669 RepID=UPI00130DE3E2|nr:ATPase domain-containing protein [Desulfosporosinus fructosivorans]
MDKVSTGILELDQILDGGLPKSSTILLVGRPGTGKTILAHQMMFQNAEDENNVLYLTTLAEPQIKIMKFQQEFSFYDTDKVQKSVIYKDLGSVLRNQGSIQAMKLIDSFLKEYQPKMIFIDTIKAFADIIPDSIEFREFILELSVRLTTWGCTTILLGEYSEQDIESRPESAIADGIIYLYGTEEKRQQKRYLRVLKMRGTKHFNGEAVFKISNDGISVFPRLNPVVIKQDYTQYSVKVPTGVSKLDEMMEGGIPQASTTLVTGPSGSGKTMLALSFALEGIRSGIKTVFVSFEENPLQIIKNSLQIGIDIRTYLDEGILHIVYVSPVELDVDEHVYRIQGLVHEIGASRLIIDSISSFEIGMSDKVKYTDYIWALTDYFKVNGITVLLTHEMRGSLDFSAMTKHGISFVADNILLLVFKEDGINLKRYLRVVKMRGSHHSTELTELIIDNNGLSLL